ncbi:MAG TPA: DUF937 domain-containing protein [Bryobacteraceae bacterium]|nr:DUF937 domain-containing protein [Bryobacteraceae bacterium]
MNLLEMLMSAGGNSAVGQLGNRFGLDENQTMAALQQLVPALGNGLQRNVAQEGGLESLLGALANGNHSQYIDNPELLDSESTYQEGNGILGHLLGSKDASRAVAAQASEQTGIGSDILKQMLPVVATMVMGSLSKQSTQAGYLGGQDAPAQPEGLLGMLTPLLDSNRDGSAVDDVIGMLGRFMKNR